MMLLRGSFGLLSGVLYSCQFVVSDEVGKLFFGYSKLVVVDSGLVSYLVGNELGMVSRRDTLVDELFLVGLLHQVRVDKLSHLNIVCEDIERHIFVLGNGYEFFTRVIRIACLISKRKSCVREGTISEGSDWGNDLTEFIIILKVFDLVSSHLLVEERAHVEGVSSRWVVLELMKKESVIKIMQNIDVGVSI